MGERPSRPLIPMDKKRIVTLVGTLVLAGAVVAAGVYGPSSWKVFRQQSAISDPVVVQSPPVDSIGTTPINGETGIPPNGTTEVVQPGATPATTITAPSPADTGSKNKYREPDNKRIDLAPSVAMFFGETALSEDTKSLAFGTVWNIHQYIDGILYGPAAGPQMNEQDIKKYIVFHKTLLDKQYKNEVNAAQAAAFTGYLDILLNSGIDALDSKDKTRIEQFHQGIHDLDAHIMRNDPSSKIYGATPFATKRS